MLFLDLVFILGVKVQHRRNRRLCIPCHVPLAAEESIHILHGHPPRLGSRDADSDETDSANACPEDKGAPDVPSHKHVGRDANDGELEEPVKHHVDSVGDTADSGGKNLGGIEVLNRAETDGPSDCVDEDNSDRGVGRRLMVAQRVAAEVNGKVDVSNSLQENTNKAAAASTKDVDEAPSKDHGEHQLGDAVRSGGDQGGTGSLETSVVENLQ